MKFVSIVLVGLAGLITLASAQEPEHGAGEARSALTWNNRNDLIYHCHDGDISKQNTKTGYTYYLGHCESGCYETTTGAGCNLGGDGAVKHSDDDVRKFDLASDIFPLVKPKETKQCSKDRRGVMTCRSGFCTVRPGGWCALNKSCYAACTCCVVDKKARRNMRLSSDD